MTVPQFPPYPPQGPAQQFPQFAPQAPAYDPYAGNPQMQAAPQYAPQQPAYQPQLPQFPPVQQPMFPQQFGQPYGLPQQRPAIQVPPGSLSAFMGQPRTGRPPALSWKGVPDGYTVQGVVADDVTDRDVVPDTDPNNGLPRTFRDGSPKYVLVVTLRVAASPAFPEGLASLYCRGDLWDKLTAAMDAGGRPDHQPRAGDLVTVSLVERRPGRGSVPKNVFSAQYAANADTAQHVPTQAPVPVAPTPPPAPQFQAPAPQAPPVQQEIPAQQAAPWGGVPTGQAVATQYQPPVQQPAPAAPQAPGMPALSPDQLALLAKLKGGAQ